MSRLSLRWNWVCLSFIVAALVGCNNEEPPASLPQSPVRHDSAHMLQGPHGGTLIQLAGIAQLEVALDAQQHQLTLYVLDAAGKNLQMVQQQTIEMQLFPPRPPRPIELTLTAQLQADGQGTAVFTVTDERLRAGVFDASLTELIVNDTAFRKLMFPFPQGLDQPARGQRIE